MSVRVRLVLASALMLFLELALIRWLGSNVVHLSYFSNFVLLGSFLGIGLGFLRSAARGHPDRPLPFYSPMALVALIGFVSAYPVTVNKDSAQLIFFTSLQPTGPPIWLTLPAIFLAVATVLAGPGEIVGASFRGLPRLDAYRYDLLGSLAGIAGFTVMSFLGAPPLAWFLVVSLLWLALLARPGLSVSIPLLAAMFIVFIYPLRHETGTFWSPYYKVSTVEHADSLGTAQYSVQVNGIPHQRLTSAATRAAEEPWYLEPYKRVPRTPERVLIVGAGTGTDVSIALAQGVGHVDAVEIDPTLLRFGRQHNPDHAYQDPRVTTHVNDGRAFLEQTDAEYDLILFALPDSLTLVSGASSLRLESYLFTIESIRSARSHLAPGGAFSMYNFYREQWLVDRLAGTIDDAFGHPPCLFDAPQAISLAVMVAGLTPADQVCDRTWARPADTPAPATDDKPFLYLRTSTIPSLYKTALLLILAASLLAIFGVLIANAFSGGARGAADRFAEEITKAWSYRDLFLLGAAFLLMETKSVTGFALLFGTTWVVNTLVFGGVLIAVLGAVETTRRFRLPPIPVLYGLLVGGLALNWFVPNSFLLGLPLLGRLPCAVAIAFLPIFAANLIFAKRFEGTGDAPLAFGVNLLGAMLGGCLEYLSLVFGYHALLVIAGMLYLGAYLIMPRPRRRDPITPSYDEDPVVAAV